jgi:hypothetical protein
VKMSIPFKLSDVRVLRACSTHGEKSNTYRILVEKSRAKRPLERQTGVKGPPLWSSGQSSWLQIQRSRFDSRRYQILEK